MTIAQQLADFIAGTRTVPEATRAMALRATFDLLSAAVVGHESPGGRAARRSAEQIWGAGQATAWFSSSRLTPTGAAFCNSAIASMLDLDDGHRAAAGHPGASVIPAVLATAEICDADAADVLVAIALGYEIGVRIAAARELNKLDTLVSGPWCGQGAAAAAAWLRGLSVEKMAQAIAIAGSTAPNLAAVAYSRVMGNHVKEGIPWATATGMSAVDLAAAGFTGPIDLFDNPDLYDAKELTGELGASWKIDGTYFKPYSCCRWAHAAIDGLLDIQASDDVPGDAIQSIAVETFSRALQLNNDVAPESLEAAQYSIPFCLALAALRGGQALLPLQESSLCDREVLALASRVSLRIDPELDAMFSEAVPARIEIATARGLFARTVTAPKGEPSNPMSWTDLEAKFQTATQRLLSPHRRAAITNAVRTLDNGDLGLLLLALALPLDQTARQQAPSLAL